LPEYKINYTLDMQGKNKPLLRYLEHPQLVELIAAILDLINPKIGVERSKRNYILNVLRN